MRRLAFAILRRRALGGVAVAVPFVASMEPSERAKAAGAPVTADISALQPGTAKLPF